MHTLFKHMTSFWAPSILLLAAACQGGGKDNTPSEHSDSSAIEDSTPSTDSDSGAVQLAGWDEARPIIEARCGRCHSADRLCTYRRLETHRDVTGLRDRILDKISEAPSRNLRMPLASNHVGEGCTPAHPALNDKRMTDEELRTLTTFLQRDDHLDYEDPYAPLVAPEVPLLADAETYSSSRFEVLNDGFLPHPDREDDDYMEDYDYDERDYDQMEDDWFCIRFDPGRTEAGYLTGVQVQTDSGQIYLNSQLVIDTTGASAAAQAAAEERGTDWYRCDGGLDFSDAIPLWRTVPGGEAVELPADTGLRFEPGWTFVLRADFHTHYDAEEFIRLDQDGVIDYDAGTMTWYNRATLRARWASPQEVDRELEWMTVGPSSSAERDAFAVVPGESTIRYSASPEEGGQYTVFSAEVGMGKLGHVASLVDSSSSTCIANNADFSPKWIEQVIYAEGDAPQLGPDSALELRCDYRNGGDEAVTWGAEGEATVWGRAERCSAVVYYYPTR